MKITRTWARVVVSLATMLFRLWKLFHAVLALGRQASWEETTLVTNLCWHGNNDIRACKQVRFHSILDGSSLAHAIQVLMGPLLMNYGRMRCTEMKRLLGTELDTHTHTGTFTHIFCAQKLLHTGILHREVFTQRSFYTQNLLHTEAFIHRCFYTQTRLHTGAFTHHSNTQNLLHTEAFPQRSLYTQKPLRTVAFAEKSFTQRRRSFYTEKDLHREAFTQAFTQGSFLHREAFPQSNSRIHTQKPSRTEVLHRKLLHKKAFALHRQLFTQRSFYTEKSWHRGPLWHCRIAILPQFCRLTVIHAKGLRLRFSKRNFTQAFAVRASCRAKGLRLKFQNCNVTPEIDIRPSFRAKGRCHATEIRISPHVCASYTHDPRRHSRFVTHGLAAPAAKREKSGQGSAGPGAGRVPVLSSPKERGAAAPAADLPPHPVPSSSPAFYGVFCCSHFSTLVAWDGSTWANIGRKMGQHSPKMGQPSPKMGPRWANIAPRWANIAL